MHFVLDCHTKTSGAHVSTYDACACVRTYMSCAMQCPWSPLSSTSPTSSPSSLKHTLWWQRYVRVIYVYVHHLCTYVYDACVHVTQSPFFLFKLLLRMHTCTRTVHVYTYCTYKMLLNGSWWRCYGQTNRIMSHTIHVFLVAFCCFLCMRTRHTYSTCNTHCKYCTYCTACENLCMRVCIIMFVHTYIQRSWKVLSSFSVGT